MAGTESEVLAMRVSVPRLLGLLLPLVLIPRAHALEPADGFVDVDRNGVYSTGDVPLASFVTVDGLEFNELQPGPGWTPRAQPVDVVIAAPLTLPIERTREPVYLTILVRGNVTIAAHVMMKRPLSEVFITSLEGDIRIAPDVRLNGNGDVTLRTYAPGGKISVGTGALVGSKGDSATTSLTAPLVEVETQAQFLLKGGGYSNLFLTGDRVAIAPNVKLTTPHRGSAAIIAGSDLTLSNLAVKAGYVHIEAYTDATSPAAKRVRIQDSVINQTYFHGDIRILAGAALASGQYAPHALVFAGSTITCKAEPLYVPLPEIE
jgi:hypothetical protein